VDIIKSLQYGYPAIMQYWEMSDKFVEEGTIIKSLLIKLLAFLLLWGKSHLRHKHLSRWKARKVCRQSKMLRREPQRSRAKELQVMNRPKIRGDCGTINRSHNP